MKSPACKVVAQYHSAGEMVYEVASANAKLEVRISSVSVGAAERSWHVSVQEGGSGDGATITESAATKASALSQVAVLWQEREAELGLTSLDWPSVTAALTAVRAI